MMRIAMPAVAALLGFGFVPVHAVENDLNASSRAYLDRPEQQKDIQAALKAKAARLPDLCPGIQFTPSELFVKSPRRRHSMRRGR